MDNKIFLICLFFFIPALEKAHAQADDFCDAINVIAKDAPNKFRNVKGKELSSSSTSIMWDCGISVPGVIAARFVVANGLFYEGAFFQTVQKDELKGAYEKYRDLLDNCLRQQGYKMYRQDNFYPGLGDYKKLAFMPELTDDAKLENAPAHITMEATYSKDVGKYTIVIYIFEH